MASSLNKSFSLFSEINTAALHFSLSRGVLKRYSLYTSHGNICKNCMHLGGWQLLWAVLHQHQPSYAEQPQTLSTGQLAQVGCAGESHGADCTAHLCRKLCVYSYTVSLKLSSQLDWLLLPPNTREKLYPIGTPTTRIAFGQTQVALSLPWRRDGLAMKCMSSLAPG